MEHADKGAPRTPRTDELGLKEVERRLEISPLVVGDDSGGMQAKPSTCCSCKIGDEDDWDRDDPDDTRDDDGP